MMFLFKEVHLERQDGEQLVNVAFDAAYAPFFPCPYLGRDIIEDFGRGSLTPNLSPQGEGNIAVESRELFSDILGYL